MVLIGESALTGLCAAVATLGITAVVVTLLGLFTWRKRMEKMLSQIPTTPERHWLFGNLQKMTFDQDSHDFMMQNVNNEDTCKMSVSWLGPFMPVVMTYHHETVKALLSTGEPKAEYIYSLLRPWIGDGLLLSSGKKWARNRRLLTPGFHFDILKPYVGIFQQSADILVENWRSACQGGEPNSQEMFSNMSLLMLDSLLKCIFSVESNCQTLVTEHPFIKGIYEIAGLIVERFRFLPYHVDLIYRWSPSGRRFRRASEAVHAYARNVIEERKRSLVEEEASGRKKQRKYVDFLDILLCAKDEDGQGLTNQEIYDEVDTFMFEGHDTTASGVSWFMYNLARHPEYQQRCRDEVDQLLADRESDKLEWDDLTKLPYLTQCLKESLRIHPPVCLAARKLIKPMTFPGGVTLPPGTLVSTLIQALHHNRFIWEDPDTFDPERFSTENAKSIQPYSFVPFSAGPRNCIGQHFAMNEMKVIAATIVRSFNLSVNESIPVRRQEALVLRAENGIHLYVEPRELKA